jgi:hypothetical protein
VVVLSVLGILATMLFMASNWEPSPEAISKMTVASLLDRIPADCVDLRAHSRALKPIPQELARRAQHDLLSDDDWRRALIAADAIHVRPRWTAGQPLIIWMREVPWLPFSNIKVKTIEPDLGAVEVENVVWWDCGNCAAGELGRRRHTRLLPLPANTSHLVLDVSIDQDQDNPKPSKAINATTRLWRGRLELPLVSVERLEDSLPSSSDVSDANALRDSMRAWWSPGSQLVSLCISIGGEAEKYPKLHGLGHSLAVELWNDDRRVGAGRLLSEAGADLRSGAATFLSYCRIEGLPYSVSMPGVDLSKWTLRVSGTSEDVLSIWEADRWWKGSFEIPLADALKAGDAK